MKKQNKPLRSTEGKKDKISARRAESSTSARTSKLPENIRAPIKPFEAWPNAAIFDDCAHGKERNAFADKWLTYRIAKKHEGDVYHPDNTQSLISGVGQELPLPRTYSVKTPKYTKVEGCITDLMDVCSNWCRTPPILLRISPHDTFPNPKPEKLK